MTSMDLLVRNQAAEPGEALVALVAAVRLLPRVRVHVVAQQVRKLEALTALLALVRPVTLVREHVPLQLALVPVALATVGALERLLLVQLLVRLHVLQESKVSAAVGALVWLLAGVDDEVLLQIAAKAEALSANLALVRLVLGMYAHVQLQHRAMAERFPALGTFV